MRRLIILLGLVALFCLAFGQAVLAGDFPDAPSVNSWVYDDFQLVNDAGLINGFPDGMFRGETPATRYQAVAFMARLMRYFEEQLGDLLTEEKVKQLIAEKCQATAAKIDEIYAAIQRLEKELRGNLDALNVRVTTLEQEVSNLKAKDVQQDAATTQLQEQVKKAKCVGILGVLLAIIGWIL